MKKPKKIAARKPALSKKSMSEIARVFHDGSPRQPSPPIVADRHGRVMPIEPEVNGSKFATLRNVVLPELWCRIELPVHVQVLEAMRPDTAGALATRKRPAALMKVRDLSDTATKDLAVVAALRSMFNTTYPDGAYVARSFRITRHRRNERKNALGYSVEEIDLREPGGDSRN